MYAFVRLGNNFLQIRFERVHNDEGDWRGWPRKFRDLQQKNKKYFLSNWREVGWLRKQIL